MRATNITTVAHKWLLNYLSPTSVVVDATTGSGNDTLFLAKHCLKVFAFDIQEEALMLAKVKTKDYSNVQYICDSHQYLNKYINELIDLIIFNLGYWPKGNKNIITKPLSTFAALQQAVLLLKEGGLVCITFYLGHIGGQDEHTYVTNRLSELSLTVIKTYTYPNKYNAPILYLLQK